MFDAWSCSECNYIGKEVEFGEIGNRLCPKCKSEDVFPHRLFKCKKCGRIAHQEKWFPEWPLDEDPLIEKVLSEPCEICLDNLSGEEEEPEFAELERVPSFSSE
ncbi:hypothetical protein H0W91_04045 [Patescibacteria group bacterium]|nr:hypothetical protein [Patescibacteria group bacterium]